MTESAKTQSSPVNVSYNSTNKHFEDCQIYYAHSLCFYNTETERRDLSFLRKTKCKIINPNGLGLGHSMNPYLKEVEACDVVWYRGDTIGVAVEVLTALALKKSVFSCETEEPISKADFKRFSQLFRYSGFFELDMESILASFGKTVHESLKKIVSDNL